MQWYGEYKIYINLKTLVDGKDENKMKKNYYYVVLRLKAMFLDLNDLKHCGISS